MASTKVLNRLFKVLCLGLALTPTLLKIPPTHSITRFGEIHQFIIHAHLDAVWGLASRYLIRRLLDLPNLAVGKVGAIVNQSEGLLWGSANVARTDWWLSDFAARDGDEESVVASLAAEKGGLEIW